MDDATSEIYSAFLVEEEGTASTFRALKQVFDCPADRGSHYFHTPEAGGKVARINTPRSRALHQLGIEHIAAYSPEARGRSERPSARTASSRNWRRGSTVEAADRFIADTYLPDHNRRFTTPPELRAFVPLDRRILWPHRRTSPDNPCATKGASSRSPPPQPVRQGKGPPRQTEPSPSSTGPDASATTPTASPSKPQPGRPRERDRPAPCGQVDSRAAPDHFPTGQTATTEADK